ncbi:hypothetical protein HQ535_00520 [bacterium]|nr:hypothetical protein [bacterium]
MRFALILGAVLTFLSGIQLFVLTGHTADFFAWTIGAGSAATAIGAFYWTAIALSYLSWRRQPWVRACIEVPARCPLPLTPHYQYTAVCSILSLDHPQGAVGIGDPRG